MRIPGAISPNAVWGPTTRIDGDKSASRLLPGYAAEVGLIWGDSEEMDLRC